MLELQIAQAPLSDERDVMIDQRAELQAGCDRLAGELAKKADSVVGVLKRFKADEAAIADEEMRLTARRQRLERTREWLQDYVIRVMDGLGTDFMRTPTATIKIQKNGGIAPLSTSRDALSSEWLDVEVRMPMRALQAICDHLSEHGTMVKVLTLIKQTAVEPANQRIRAALAERCEICAGAGKVLAVIRVSQGPEETPCEACEGTGSRQIKGAKLEARGRHLRIS